MMDDMTLFEQRKRDMMQLWKDTFHDSDNYIKLVFDTYFSPDNSFVRYDENRLIASLLCVPYEFQILTKRGTKSQLKGMYLCGLATRPEWRRQGIMAELMEEAQESAKSKGYDLTFLIPADEHLRDYYSRKGYRTSSYRQILTWKATYSDNEEGPSKLNIYSIKKLLTDGKAEFLIELADWCRALELSRPYNTILHSRKDLMAAMAENENSIFLTDSTFDLKFPILAKVAAVAFPELSDATNGHLKIVELYLKDEYLRSINTAAKTSLKTDDGHYRHHKLLMEKSKGNTIDNFHTIIANDSFNRILKYFEEDEMKLLLPFGNINSAIKERVVPYAMTKILHNNEKIIENENFEFRISLLLD